MIYIIGGCLYLLLFLYQLFWESKGKERKFIARLLHFCGVLLVFWGLWEFRDMWTVDCFLRGMFLAIPSAYVCYLLDSLITGFRLKRQYLTFSGILRLKKQQQRALWREAAAVVVNAVYEEVLFRLVLYEITMYWLKWKPAAAIVMIAYFAFLHMRFDGKLRYVQMIDLTVFSAVLVTTYLFCGSLLFCVLLHSGRNMLVVMQRYIFYAEREEKQEKIRAKLRGGIGGYGEEIRDT